MTCKKCNSTKFYTKTVNIHIGIYCESCNTWQKWKGKNEFIEGVRSE